MVYIKPKGPVPVLALEWQISSEVPNNLSALKKAAESATPEYIEVTIVPTILACASRAARHKCTSPEVGYLPVSCLDGVDRSRDTR